ncbi:amino acid permease [Gracilibacillus salitolerans]|uniref:Amino acid permease n=1 Tax=Gracilibacillus salitolerans TaxID=2663022 RepID=A0A5Q2TG48_9BACI|nr:amino acid permease [Gracilibacillus salitolerans]QGH33187.1 amino acid permease [Gracilibacillus salitolerans]
MSETSSASEKKIAWWQLALTGVGCTIGTGYFLGSSIGIKLTGPSIVFSFLIAAIGTYIVFNLLAKMSAADPQEGSFCYYAEKAFGKWAGFSCGWNYWCSSILIMGSQLIALAILTKAWFPNIPLWVFAGIYAILSILVILLGTRGFDRIEDFLAVIKTAAIFMFIIIAFIALAGGIPGGSDSEPGIPNNLGDTFTGGIKGFWASLIYAFYAFGGIEVIGLMAIRLKKKEDAPKTGKVMLGLLAIIYIISLCLAVIMAPVEQFDPSESPFVTALSDYSLPFFPHVFNAAIIVAGFSTMTAALFGVVTLLVTLAKDGDAPKLFSKKLKKFKELPLPSLLLATIGLAVSVITALLLPEKIYEYITTAAGILLLFNWAFIILSSWRVLEGIKLLNKVIAWVGLLFIVTAVSGTLMDKSIRPGFWISLLLVVLIGGVTLLMVRHWKKVE